MTTFPIGNISASKGMNEAVQLSGLEDKEIYTTALQLVLMMVQACAILETQVKLTNYCNSFKGPSVHKILPYNVVLMIFLFLLSKF